MRRVVSIWLPLWPLERLRRQQCRQGHTGANTPPDDAQPFALIQTEQNALRLTAVNPAAAAEGLGIGQSLSDARTLVPELAVHPSDPAADAKALRALADWCGRFTPWCNVDGRDGLWLDISGCAHLFGGEKGLLEEMQQQFARLGLTARIGLADTNGAAWAAARFDTIPENPCRILPPGGPREGLEALPVEALRLEHRCCAMLKRLGLQKIGQLMAVPRASLARRFASTELSEAVLLRLDQALGNCGEPVSPLQPVPVHFARLGLPEPLISQEALETSLDLLLEELCGKLGRAECGARALELLAYRTDGSVARIAVATGRPGREQRHFRRLFEEKLSGIDAGFGIEILVLQAAELEPLGARQASLSKGDAVSQEAETGRLVDRLSNRVGAEHVQRLASCESHIPERAEKRVAANSPSPSKGEGRDGGWPMLPQVRIPKGSQGRSTPTSILPLSGGGSAQSHPVRPSRLLAQPEPVHVVAAVPEGPPMRFTWRKRAHRVVRAEGPERIAPEWWLEEGTDFSRLRDYYRVEDEAGGGFWLYREGLYQLSRENGPPRWFMHGFFA